MSANWNTANLKDVSERSNRILKMPLRILRSFVGPERYEKIRYHAYNILYRDQGYNWDYYSGIDSANQHCFELLAKSLIDEFSPSSVIDVGCGSGGISAALMRAGCEKIYAFDFSADSVEFSRAKGIPFVQQLDVTKADTIPAKGDLVICFEVAEHIPAPSASRLCRLLSEAAPNIAFTAARPGQGGHLHVNVQPQSYWIEMMREYHMEFDQVAVSRLRTRFGGRMISDYNTNLMVFRRAV